MSQEIYSRCAFQRLEGGIIGELCFPDCMGSRCAGFITSTSICMISGQEVIPNPQYLTNPNW
jgi:hypothetical protein